MVWILMWFGSRLTFSFPFLCVPMALRPLGPTAHFAMYLTKRDAGGMEKQMRCLESLADGQSHKPDVRIESRDDVRSTSLELEKKCPAG